MSAEQKSLSIDELKDKGRSIRELIIRMTTAAGSGHPSSRLSAVEIVTALFFGGIMKYDPQNPKWAGRDRFILSKGHAVPVLYAAMAEAGYFSPEDCMTLRKLGSKFEGHPNMKRLAGIEASTGSLGQGLSIGVGHALAGKMDKADYNVFVMLGDGELGEGQVWEAASAAHKYRLSNLTAIVDQNGYQQTGATKDVLDMKPVADKFAAFGWHTLEIEGNDQKAALEALQAALAVKEGPTAIVSRTKKGFGILPVLETTGDLNYHGKPLSPELAEKAIALIEAS